MKEDLLMKHLKSRPQELKGLKPTLIKKAKDYVYSKIEFYVKDNSLYIKMTGPGEKAKWFVLENYKNHTALEVISECAGWGRCFEDGILELWQLNDLKFGWIVGE